MKAFKKLKAIERPNKVEAEAEDNVFSLKAAEEAVTGWKKYVTSLEITASTTTATTPQMADALRGLHQSRMRWFTFLPSSVSSQLDAWTQEIELLHTLGTRLCAEKAASQGAGDSQVKGEESGKIGANGNPSTEFASSQKEEVSSNIKKAHGGDDAARRREREFAFELLDASIEGTRAICALLAGALEDGDGESDGLCVSSACSVLLKRTVDRLEASAAVQNDDDEEENDEGGDGEDVKKDGKAEEAEILRRTVDECFFYCGCSVAAIRRFSRVARQLLDETDVLDTTTTTASSSPSKSEADDGDTLNERLIRHLFRKEIKLAGADDEMLLDYDDWEIDEQETKETEKLVAECHQQVLLPKMCEVLKKAVSSSSPASIRSAFNVLWTSKNITDTERLKLLLSTQQQLVCLLPLHQTGEKGGEASSSSSSSCGSVVPLLSLLSHRLVSTLMSATDECTTETWSRRVCLVAIWRATAFLTVGSESSATILPAQREVLPQCITFADYLRQQPTGIGIGGLRLLTRLFTDPLLLFSHFVSNNKHNNPLLLLSASKKHQRQQQQQEKDEEGGEEEKAAAEESTSLSPEEQSSRISWFSAAVDAVVSCVLQCHHAALLKQGVALRLLQRKREEEMQRRHTHQQQHQYQQPRPFDHGDEDELDDDADEDDEREQAFTLEQASFWSLSSSASQQASSNSNQQHVLHLDVFAQQHLFPLFKLLRDRHEVSEASYRLLQWCQLQSIFHHHQSESRVGEKAKQTNNKLHQILCNANEEFTRLVNAAHHAPTNHGWSEERCAQEMQQIGCNWIAALSQAPLLEASAEGTSTTTTNCSGGAFALASMVRRCRAKLGELAATQRNRSASSAAAAGSTVKRTREGDGLDDAEEGERE